MLLPDNIGCQLNLSWPLVLLNILLDIYPVWRWGSVTVGGCGDRASVDTVWQGWGWGWWPGRGQLRQSSPSSEALISPAYCEHCDLQSPTLANTRDLTTRRGLGSNSSNLIHWPIVPSKVSAKVCAVCNQRRESVRGRVIVTIEKVVLLMRFKAFFHLPLKHHITQVP